MKMTRSVSLHKRLMVVASALLMGAFFASSAHASHLWTFVSGSETCDSSTNTVEFTMNISDGQDPLIGLFINFSVDGQFIEMVTFYDDGSTLPAGDYNLSYTNASLVAGAVVEIDPGANAVSVTCEPPPVFTPINVNTLAPSGLLLLVLLIGILGFWQVWQGQTLFRR